MKIEKLKPVLVEGYKDVYYRLTPDQEKINEIITVLNDHIADTDKMVDSPQLYNQQVRSLNILKTGLQI